MTFLRLFSTLFLLLSFSFAKESIRVGCYYKQGFVENDELSEVSTKLWEKYINDEYPDLNLKLIIYGDKNRLLEDYKSKKVVAIIANEVFYFRNKVDIKSASNKFYIISRIEKKFEKLFLVKNKNSDFSLENPKGRVLFVDENAKLWFNSLLIKSDTNLEYERVNKKNKLIFIPYFKKDVVSILNENLYDTMIEINPQVKNNITVLKESKRAFFLGMVFVHKSLEPKIYKRVDELFEHINNSKNSLKSSSYINIENIFQVGNKELKELENFYQKKLYK